MSITPAQNPSEDPYQCYELSLTLQAPLLSKASGTLHFGLDSAMQKYQGLPVLRGSLIRGLLRHTLSQFAALLEEKTLEQQINTWFGQPSPSLTDMEPHRAKVHFDFFWQLKNPATVVQARRTRIRMDEYEKAADGALQIIEDCFPLGGDNPIFTGRLRARFSGATPQAVATEKQAFETGLDKALYSLPALGSLKGIGFGKLISHQLTPLDNTATVPLSLPAHSQRFGIRLLLDRPLCIGRTRTHDSNQVVSTDLIPGNVLKAVIANELSEEDRRRLNIDKIAISHALPAPADETQSRPQAIPLSLACYDKPAMTSAKKQSRKKSRKQWVDVADLIDPENPTHWENPSGTSPRFNRPAFQPDWKAADRAHLCQPYQQECRPARLTVVRTQIELGYSNTAKEGGLFSMECCDTRALISTEDQSGIPEYQPLAWYAGVDISATPNPEAVKDALLAIFGRGLCDIGKSKAYAHVSVIEQPEKTACDYPVAALPEPGETVIVTLMSDARILPFSLENIAGTGSQQALRAYYAGYWGDAFILQDYYAQQKRSGGEFSRQHFRKKNSDTQYQPAWLTVAGSVFVLTIKNAEGQQQLERWQKTGIPPYPDLDDSAGALPFWKQSPHLPEHGFGQIIIRTQDPASAFK